MRRRHFWVQMGSGHPVFLCERRGWERDLRGEWEHYGQRYFSGIYPARSSATAAAVVSSSAAVDVDVIWMEDTEKEEGGWYRGLGVSCFLCLGTDFEKVDWRMWEDFYDLELRTSRHDLER
jgi:hypothetical protein